MTKTETFIPQPFQLFNKIQHYEWGTMNDAAFIPKLLGEPVVPDTPYAELWIGTHPKASSEMIFNGQNVSLGEVIKQFPIEMLGSYTAAKFNNSLPYLFKVLSARKALSIQTHPNKEQAVKLHARDSVNYPDANHKPEIAIALDNLSALCGFLPKNIISENFTKYPEICAFAGCNIEEDPEVVYKAIMMQHDSRDGIASALNAISKRIQEQPDSEEAEKEFLRQFEIFGADIGLFSFFFFNYVTLLEGQGIFTDAGVPHAYIHGNIVECMANSDNVVRAGLTGKFTDVSTLLDILRFDFTHVKVLLPNIAGEKSYYNPGAEEFSLVFLKTFESFEEVLESDDKPRLILIVAGSIEITCGSQKSVYHQGESIFLPASLTSCKLSSIDPLKAFIVEIP
jgi:mannose-6-phosphate isomerase